ncbi:hypothetical protein DFQ05_0498 [Winogradskyella wandonensis]|uniref:Uncharacterized protein n=1 Tax=Winogradskyella wandonensis TaxID=1442586 RepID=A0A4R1KW83_9FLAO|nr:hypothetical protein [Winogradskyella wandonensis]TCK68987.1 hypothetical protein DFQ05_0498 [Winogradskyella wandonensis]
MKILLAALLIIPFLSFGQVSQDEKEEIETYALEICDCFNNVLKELHPKAIEAITIYASEGEQKMQEYVVKVLAEESDAEKQAFMESFQSMQESPFLIKLQRCDASATKNEALKEKMDDSNSEVSKYLINYLGKEDSCKLFKFFYDLGTNQN